MKVYELFEVNSKPKRNDCRYTEYRIYNNSLYIQAECNVDCKYDAEEGFTEEEYNRLVELELKGIIQTLETHGRYPMNGIPKFVAY
jgi:hypothetical protein